MKKILNFGLGFYPKSFFLINLIFFYVTPQFIEACNVQEMKTFSTSPKINDNKQTNSSRLLNSFSFFLGISCGFSSFFCVFFETFFLETVFFAPVFLFAVFLVTVFLDEIIN
ncbi:hypothetical protein BpHYR1_008115 [Brachionus plicatilis]|uniref:Uncharacterized protein n=1 Tax=Brachionus plicatilis TaxID=10195 RepID=A0A3M7R6A8_BRAPC|nr:hypothetical protein BpHYR1_008115 [Brachionus plicatilis]